MVVLGTYGQKGSEWSTGTTKNKAIWVMMHAVPYSSDDFPGWIRCLFVYNSGSSAGWSRRL